MVGVVDMWLTVRMRWAAEIRGRTSAVKGKSRRNGDQCVHRTVVMRKMWVVCDDNASLGLLQCELPRFCRQPFKRVIAVRISLYLNQNPPARTSVKRRHFENQAPNFAKTVPKRQSERIREKKQRDFLITVTVGSVGTRSCHDRR